MLDISLLRKNPDAVKASQRARYQDEATVDLVLDLDKQAMAAQYEASQLRKNHNSLSKEYGMKMRAGEDVTELAEQISVNKAKLAASEELEKELLQNRDSILSEMGNIVMPDVPIHNDEDFNKVLRTFGECKTGECLSHYQILDKVMGTDTDKGAAIAGSRGFFLMGDIARLNHALVCYGMDFLSNRGFVPMQTPFFMTRDMMAKCAQLDDFDEQLYKVSGEGEDKYLIATSEQPLCAYNYNERYQEKDLPLRFAGMSTCFRKEAGRHGADQLGIFRIHQFEKVEQFTVTSPVGDASEKMFDEMIGNSEAFYQSLGIPYRIVHIVSGALNNAAAKKNDLEAWFPGSQAYRELVSCSNCTDYQSRRLNCRYGTGKVADEHKYCHLLNCTLTATERTLCCIVENYATEEGIIIPEALRPYMNNKDIIPYRK